VIVPLPKTPPTKLERFARGFFTPSIRLMQKYAPSMVRLEWEYPRLDRFIRAMRAKGYTEDQVKEGVRLLIDRTAEKIAKRKGLEGKLSALGFFRPLPFPQEACLFPSPLPPREHSSPGWKLWGK